MQVFVIGPTKSGKSTLAKIVQHHGYTIYEAGAWARNEFAQINTGPTDEFSPIFKDNLTAYALTTLSHNPYYSVEQYEQFLATHTGNTVVVGVRNPDDFIHMLRLDHHNKVIVIDSDKQSSGQLGVFEGGLKIIEDYLAWKNSVGAHIEVLRVSEQCINHHQIAAFLQGDL